MISQGFLENLTMYCPNCETEHNGKFCPECGTKLTEKPAEKEGSKVSIGDANVINGGVHLTDSHEVHNEDNSIHNITNITNVSAQKTEIELLQERKILYLNACKRAYEDNVLEQSEKIELDRYRLELGLDEVTADNLLEQVRQMTLRSTQKTELTSVGKIKLKQFSEALEKNDMQAVLRQIDSIGALAGKFDNDELQCKYHMVLAAIRHEKCIEMFEQSKVDNYWKSFWTYLAYLKANKSGKASEVLFSLGERFPYYPEDNITLLAAAGSFVKNEKEEAHEYLNEVTGDHTPVLQRFAETVYLLLNPEMAKEMGIDEYACTFHLVNFFGQEDPKIKAEKEARRKAEEEARRKAEEEARRKAEEEERRRAEEDKRKKAEEEARMKVFEEKRRQAEAEAKIILEQREASELKAKEEIKIKEKNKADKNRIKREQNAKLNYYSQNWIPLPSTPFLGFQLLDKNAKTVSIKYLRNTTFSPPNELTIPSTFNCNGIMFTVDSIGDFAFEECEWLKAITIPESVGSIGENAFFGCHKLKDIEFESKKVFVRCNSFDDTPFGESKLMDYVKKGIIVVYINKKPNLIEISPSGWECTSPDFPYLLFSFSSNHSNNSSDWTYIVSPRVGFRLPHHLIIPTEVESGELVNIEGFSNFDEIQTIEILKPDRVRDLFHPLKIEKNSFQDCSNLTSILFRDAHNLVISDGAFSRCKKLSTITFEGSSYNRRHVSRKAFSGCPLSLMKRVELLKYMTEEFFE